MYLFFPLSLSADCGHYLWRLPAFILVLHRKTALTMYNRESGVTGFLRQGCFFGHLKLHEAATVANSDTVIFMPHDIPIPGLGKVSLDSVRAL